MDLIHIFPISNDVEIPFILIVAILISFSMKCHFMSFAQFPVGSFGLFSLPTLESSRYQTSVGYEMWKIFSPSVACLFNLLPVEFAELKFLILLKPNLPILFFYGSCFCCVVTKNSSRDPWSERFFF